MSGNIYALALFLKHGVQLKSELSYRQQTTVRTIPVNGSVLLDELHVITNYGTLVTHLNFSNAYAPLYICFVLGLP